MFYQKHFLSKCWLINPLRFHSFLWQGLHQQNNLTLMGSTPDPCSINTPLRDDVTSKWSLLAVFQRCLFCSGLIRGTFFWLAEWREEGSSLCAQVDWRMQAGRRLCHSQPNRWILLSPCTLIKQNTISNGTSSTWTWHAGSKRLLG